MNIEAEAASQVTSIYLKSLELSADIAIKLGGKVFKLVGKSANFILEHIIKSIRQEGKFGELKLNNMLRRANEEGKTLTVYQCPIETKEKAEMLAAEFERYGISFSMIESNGVYEMLVFAEDAPRINHITEKLGLNVVEKTEDIPNPKKTAQYETTIPDDVKEYTNTNDLINNIFEKDKQEDKSFDYEIPNDVMEYGNADSMLNRIFGEEKQEEVFFDVDIPKDVNEYSNDEELINAIFEGKEQQVPLKGSDRQQTQNQFEPISPTESKTNGNGRQLPSIGQQVKEIRREHEENHISSFADKSAENTKTLAKEALTK